MVEPALIIEGSAQRRGPKSRCCGSKGNHAFKKCLAEFHKGSVLVLAALAPTSVSDFWLKGQSRFHSFQNGF